MLYGSLLAGIGGFLGAVLRFFVTAVFSVSAAGILFVNVSGSFLAGFFLGLPFGVFSPNARIFAVAGFLGAFTTFSAFSVETLLFIKAGNYKAAVSNVLLNVVLCFAGAAAGFFLADKFVK